MQVLCARRVCINATLCLDTLYLLIVWDVFLYSLHNTNPVCYAEIMKMPPLWSAREAALRLGVNPRTAQLRAGRAYKHGDKGVMWLAGAYCAPESWWRELFAGPVRPGRPPTKRVHVDRDHPDGP